MKLGLTLRLGGFQPSSLALPSINITAIPTLSGTTAATGDVTRSGQSTSDTPGASIVSSIWYIDGVGSGSNASDVYDKSGIDTAFTIRVRETWMAAGYANAVTDSANLSVVAVAPPVAPVAAGGLADLDLIVGSAMSAVDVLADFTGTGITVPLTSGTLPAGLFFDGTNLSGTPTGVVSATLVFTGTNGGGSDTTGFQIDVTAAVITAGTSPVMGALVEGNAISSENGTNGVYSSDYPSETFADGVDGASLVPEYQVGSGAWTNGAVNAVEGQVIGKRVVVTGSESTTSLVTAAGTVTVADAGVGGTPPPTLSAQTWDNPSGIGSVTSDAAGRLHLCTYNSASGTPSASGAGWSGAALEIFSQEVSVGSNGLSFSDTALSATVTHFAYFIRNAAGKNSLVQSHVFSQNNAGPVLVPASCTPSKGATDVVTGSNITLIFDEAVVEGAGDFFLYQDGVLSETIAVADATFGTTDVVLDPLSNLATDVNVSVRWGAGAIADRRGNAVLANTSNTLLNFQSAAVTASSFGITRLQSAAKNNAGIASVTFNAFDLGALPSGSETRTIIIGASCTANTGKYPVLALNGVAMTLAPGTATTQTENVAFYYLDEHSLTSADVTCTFDGGNNGSWPIISGWRMINGKLVDSDGNYNNGFPSIALSANTVAGGVSTMICRSGNQGTQSTSHTFAGVSEDDATIQSSRLSTAKTVDPNSAATPASIAVGGNGVNNRAGAAICTWESI